MSYFEYRQGSVSQQSSTTYTIRLDTGFKLLGLCIFQKINNALEGLLGVFGLLI